MKKPVCFFAAFLIFVLAGRAQGTLWTKAKANQWYASKGWLRGCDFIPSTAINQLEMWQAASFDTTTINRELGYAESIGLNCMRVFLH
ncbi:MAG: 1,4-beta-xylanase, partial [Bacteroidota bacterium]